MTYRRKVPTVHQILEMFLLQGGRLRCYRTQKRITLKNFRNTQREHVVELGLFAGNADKAAHDTPDNWRMSFSEAHAVITNGTKATSAGSSKHRIAKAKRQEKDRLQIERVPPGPYVAPRDRGSNVLSPTGPGAPPQAKVGDLWLNPADGKTYRRGWNVWIEMPEMAHDERGSFMPVKYMTKAEAKKIWPNKPKLQSRGFDRTKTKGFGGAVRNRKPRLDRG